MGQALQQGYLAALIWKPTDYVLFALNGGRLVYDDAAIAGTGGDRDYGATIVGVRSRCQKDSLKVYRNKTLISDWIFSAADDIYGLPAGASGGSSPSGDGGDPVDKK